MSWIERNRRRAAGPIVIGACLVLWLGAAAARAEEEKTSGEDVEDRVERLSEEVEKLKDEVAAQKEAAAAAKLKLDSQNPVVRIADGLVIEEPRGSWALRFNGRIQGDFRAFQPNDIVADTFSVRRARIAAGLTAGKYYQMFVETEFINGAATGTTTQGAALTHGWLEFSWFPPAKIRIGQFKPQFGLENASPDVLTDMQERSYAFQFLQNLNYDRGIMVHSAPVPGFFYGATLSNGAGLNLEESQGNRQEADTDGKDLTARATVNVAELGKKQGAIFHVGGDWKNGSVISRNGAAFNPITLQSEARGLTFFSSAPLGLGQIDRRLVAAEGLVSIDRWKVQGEGWEARYAGDVPERYDRTLRMYYVAAGWLITGEKYADFYKNGGFGRMKPRNDFAPRKDPGWGAWEVMARYTAFDGSEFTASNPVGTGVLAAGATNRAHAVTLGVKWLPNQFVRLMVNYVRTDFSTPVTVNAVTTPDERAWTFRAQMDF